MRGLHQLATVLDDKGDGNWEMLTWPAFMPPLAALAASGGASGGGVPTDWLDL